MSKNTQIASAVVNTQADALSALLNSGYIKIYDGTQPADANTAVSTQTLLCTLTFSATAAPSASNGLITFNTITGANAVATSTATWYRCLKSDGTTVVMDGSIGTSGANLNLVTTSIVSGQPVSITSFTHDVNPATSGY
jgi:hypothetical protein